MMTFEMSDITNRNNNTTRPTSSGEEHPLLSLLPYDHSHQGIQESSTAGIAQDPANVNADRNTDSAASQHVKETQEALLVTSKPKRPLSAYNLFFRDQRQMLMEQLTAKSSSFSLQKANCNDKDDETKCSSETKEKQPKINFQTLGKIIGARWRDIDPDEKERYEHIAAEGRQEYLEKAKEWKRLQKLQPPKQKQSNASNNGSSNKKKKSSKKPKLQQNQPQKEIEDDLSFSLSSGVNPNVLASTFSSKPTNHNNNNNNNSSSSIHMSLPVMAPAMMMPTPSSRTGAGSLLNYHESASNNTPMMTTTTSAMNRFSNHDNSVFNHGTNPPLQSVEQFRSWNSKQMNVASSALTPTPTTSASTSFLAFEDLEHTNDPSSGQPPHSQAFYQNSLNITTSVYPYSMNNMHLARQSHNQPSPVLYGSPLIHVQEVEPLPLFQDAHVHSPFSSSQLPVTNIGGSEIDDLAGRMGRDCVDLFISMMNSNGSSSNNNNNNSGMMTQQQKQQQTNLCAAFFE